MSDTELLAAAIDRLAAAIEQAVLGMMDTRPIPAVLSATHAPAFAPLEALPDEPPHPASFPAIQWSVGQSHAAGHRPLRMNARGLFCPTKVDGDKWCEWRP